MGKGGGSAPSPDPNIGKAALKQAQIGEAWLGFAKDAFKISQERQVELDALTKRVTEAQLGMAEDQARWSREDRQRYESQFKPIEDDFIKEANAAGSPERQAAAAAEAKADVATAAAASRAAASREASSMGIAPGSGRFAGINRAGELGTTLATAGAANTARTAQRDKGLALKADVVNLGRGLPAQSAQAAALGLNAGSTAVGLNQANMGLSNQAGGIMGAGYQGAMQGYGNQANTLQNLHNSNVQVWQTQQQMAAANAQGIGSAIGSIAGLFLSDEDAKENKEEIPEGEALEAIKEMPVESWKYKEGMGDGEQHVGPYAQDFKEATGKGDGHTIPGQDALGITMKAVQDLDAKVERIADAVGIGLAPQKESVTTPEKRRPKAARKVEAAPAREQAAPKPAPVHDHAAHAPRQGFGLGLQQRAA